MADITKTTEAGLAQLTKELAERQEQHERALKVQSALYRIAEAVGTVQDMGEFYATMHHIVGELMYAENFYIILFDPDKDWVEAVYFADQAGDPTLPPAPKSLYAKTPSVYVYDTGEALHLSNVDFRKMAREGILEPVGSISEDWIGVPVMDDDQVLGVVVVQSYEEGVFYSEGDVEILTFVGRHIAAALSRPRAIEETRQRNFELQIINSVQEGLASKLDLKAIYELVGEKLRQIFRNSDVTVAVYDPETDMAYAPFLVEKGQRLEIEPIKVDGQGFLGAMVRDPKPIIVNENLEEAAEKVGSYLVEGSLYVPKSMVNMPLVVDGELRGNLLLQDMDQEHAFTDSDVRLLETIANSMSVALENARLLDETQRLLKESEQHVAELATINTVSNALAGELDLEALIPMVGEQIRTTFKADSVYVALLDEGTNTINFPYQCGEELDPMQYGQGLTSKVIESGVPLLINREMDKQREELGATLVGKQARSYLGVPIFAGVKPIGVVSVQNTERENVFSENDQRTLGTIAANISTAIRNASLFDEIKRQKQYYEAVIENSPVAIVLITPELDVVGWNPAAEKLFGYAEAEALGRNIDALVAKTEDLHSEAVSFSQQGLREFQGRLITKRTRKDRSLVDVEVSSLPVFVDSEHAAFIVIYHDITELQLTRQAAEQANRAKSTFLANMSHELRTPLNAILGFSRIVRRKGKDALPEKQIENLDKVLVSAEHLLGLINTVLDISKIEAGRMDVQSATFELAPLINQVVSTSQPLVKKGVELVAEIPSDLPTFNSDQDKIKQILINLLSNAAKFTHQGEISLTARRDDEVLYIDVSDSGIGISEDALERIFEEFQQADTGTTREYGDHQPGRRRFHFYTYSAHQLRRRPRRPGAFRKRIREWDSKRESAGTCDR